MVQRPRHGSALLVALGVGLAALGASGCGQHEGDATPTAALRSFLDAMNRSNWDDKALEDAYQLLSKDARDALDARAAMTTALAGRQVEPWQMLVQGRFHLSFTPKRDGMTARIHGDHATVVVRGADGERADVPMVREGSHWRVALEVPPIHHPHGGGGADGTPPKPGP